MRTITVKSLKQLLKQNADIQLIDVREFDEFKSGHIEGASNMPLSSFEQYIHEFNKDEDYIIICRSGNRSNMACEFLEQYNVKTTNVQGGMTEWNLL